VRGLRNFAPFRQALRDASLLQQLHVEFRWSCAARQGFALIGQQIGHMDKKDHMRAAGASAAWMVMVRNGTPFVEHTKTLIVNAHGALLQLQEPVREGQALNVRNVTTGEEMPCKVVDLSPGATGLAEIGVEFATVNPRFWRVSFPPADRSTRSLEAKRFASSPSAAPPPRERARHKKVVRCSLIPRLPCLLYPPVSFRASFPWANYAHFW
jgi:hypothetical protein